MKNFNLNKYTLLLIILFFFSTIKSFSQSINEERKRIIGKWVLEEDSWTFIFHANNKCDEYYKGKLEASYLYKITSANSFCGKQLEVNKNDTLISFLQLDDTKTNERTCFEINGVSAQTLSLSGYPVREISVFNRKHPKPESIKIPSTKNN